MLKTEEFMAAVDFLSVQEDVDSEKIGIIGICGWGGMALNADGIRYTYVPAQQSAAQYRRGNRKGQEINQITCLHFSEKPGKQWTDQKNTK